MRSLLAAGAELRRLGGAHHDGDAGLLHSHSTVGDNAQAVRQRGEAEECVTALERRGSALEEVRLRRRVPAIAKRGTLDGQGNGVSCQRGRPIARSHARALRARQLERGGRSHASHRVALHPIARRTPSAAGHMRVARSGQWPRPGPVAPRRPARPVPMRVVTAATPLTLSLRGPARSRGGPRERERERERDSQRLSQLAVSHPRSAPRRQNKPHPRLLRMCSVISMSAMLVSMGSSSGNTPKWWYAPAPARPAALLTPMRAVLRPVRPAFQRSLNASCPLAARSTARTSPIAATVLAAGDIDST
mmetsp:Transcript_5676/g.22397  ORF Transcript_5676/g.22397 Transcript_5676/m.22397 type:complete len:305 (+) Transcript_5676:76-990(+)